MPLKFLSANLGSSRFYFFNKTNPKFAFLTFSPTSGPKLSLLSFAIPYPATPQFHSHQPSHYRGCYIS